MVQAYCLHCKTQVDVANEATVLTKNGLQRLTGNCPVCNTRVSKILGKGAGDGAEKEASEWDSLALNTLAQSYD